MSEYPSPTLSVIKALEQWGGWSRIFAMSLTTYEAKHIVVRQNDPRFWGIWAQTRADEIFGEEVEDALREFIEIFGLRRPKKELRMMLAKAMISEGWHPPKTRILREMRDLRRSIKEDIKALKAKSNSNSNSRKRRSK